MAHAANHREVYSTDASFSIQLLTAFYHDKPLKAGFPLPAFRGDAQARVINHCFFFSLGRVLNQSAKRNAARNVIVVVALGEFPI